MEAVAADAADAAPPGSAVPVAAAASSSADVAEDLRAIDLSGEGLESMDADQLQTCDPSRLECVRSLSPHTCATSLWALACVLLRTGCMPAARRSLLLMHNRIVTMGGELRRFLRLERLSLRANRIKAISGLEMCASLQELELYENQLTSLHGLEGLRSLTTLDASFNQICEIDGLAGLHALTSLYLANNKIEKIGGLDGLASLRLLELGSNAIRLVENLASVPSLTVREREQPKPSPYSPLHPFTPPIHTSHVHRSCTSVATRSAL